MDSLYIDVILGTSSFSDRIVWIFSVGSALHVFPWTFIDSSVSLAVMAAGPLPLEKGELRPEVHTI